MSKIKLSLLIIMLISWANLLSVDFASAMEFEPNDIISNSDLQDYDSMTQESIQEFLNNQAGILKNYHAIDYFDIEKTAAEIIYNAAQAYKINPQWILATLQKEQSLITNPSPTQYNQDWAMGYGVCDSCSVDDPALQLFKGFGNQVDRATWRIRYYYDNPEKFNFHVGQLYSIDGRDVMIFNQATANLYNYTPHLHGNENFWKIWNRWFAKIYPDGTLVKQEGKAGVWLLENGKRRPFWSKTALLSRYDETKVIEISRNDLQRYEEGYPIKYPNFSLLSSPAGQIYLTVNNEKKQIESPEVFKLIGYNPEEVIQVTDEELGYYEEGRKITVNSLYPQGALLQDKKSGGVYYVEDGIKYPIADKTIMKANYPKFKITAVSSDELNKYITAANGVKLKDGVLIKSKTDPKVYVVSNGERRWIANEQTFKQLGYKFSNILDVNDIVLNLHAEGQALDLLLADSQIVLK